MNPRWTIALVNRAACKLTGLPSDAMLGQSMQCMAATPQDHALWSTETATARDGFQSSPQVLRKDGKLVPVEQRVLRIAYSRGAGADGDHARSQRAAGQRAELETLLLRAARHAGFGR